MVQLHRGAVVEAAVAILDDYGLADLTMRRLATALDVAPGALYWHFPNKQTLLGAVTDRILAPMEQPAAEDHWAERLAELAHRLRDALLAHRDGAELVAASVAARLTASPVREIFTATAQSAGLPAAEAALAADTVLYYVLGYTVDEQSRMHMDSAGALPEDASPLSDPVDASTRFAFGLRLFLGGITARTALRNDP